VEQEGVRRAQARAAEADLVLWLVDGAITGQVAGAVVPAWTVRTKIDLDAPGPGAAGFDFRISATRGDGVKELVAALVGFARNYFGSGEAALIGRARQRELLQHTAASLRRSLAVAGKGEELAAEELRTAAHSLGKLLGRVDVEDILDVIFREFCVGK
jgi:tRNA modification GTPase